MADTRTQEQRRRIMQSVKGATLAPRWRGVGCFTVRTIVLFVALSRVLYRPATQVETGILER